MRLREVTLIRQIGHDISNRGGTERKMTQAREWLTLHFPSMESREGFGAFFNKRAVTAEPSWRAVDTGHVTVAPYGGYSETCGSCGADCLPEDHRFCGICGSALKKGAAA